MTPTAVVEARRDIERVTYRRPNMKKDGWKLYPEQLEAIWDPARITVIEASTKSGKTVGCMLWLLEHAMQGRAGQEFWWVAPIFAQAKIAYRRFKRGLPKRIYQKNDTELTLTLGNGAILRFLGSDNPDSLYGEDVYAVVIDEASRCKEEAWHAVRSTITATRGPVRIIGNVKGRKNWAYRLGRRALAGEIRYGYHKITAWHAVKAGVLDEEEIREAEKDLPPDVFAELYLAEPTEEGANPFGGAAAIGECLLADLDLDVEPVVWGWDLARHHDWTVGVGLDEQKRVVAFERWQKPWIQCEDDIVATVGGKFGLVDDTGLGDPVLAALQDKTKHGAFEGYTFSSQSKQKLMEHLALQITRQDIWYPDNEIKTELEDFEYEHSRTGVRYSAPEGLHDDCVCALALAAWAYDHCSWRPVDLW